MIDIARMSVFDTNAFFSGGAGMFLQYHDVLKPVKLYAVWKMMLTDQSYGLPMNIIKRMSNYSLIEWYLNRRYINPLQQLDYAKKADPEQLDSILMQVLRSDQSLYTTAPMLNPGRMFLSYHQQHMSFPVFVYTEEEEPSVAEDCRSCLAGIPVHYVHGNLKECLKKCDQNYTYIFSDINTAKNAIELLSGTFSHVLVARDYRYNFKMFRGDMKYNLNELARKHPYIRPGLVNAVDFESLAGSMKSVYME